MPWFGSDDSLLSNQQTDPPLLQAALPLLVVQPVNTPTNIDTNHKAINFRFISETLSTAGWSASPLVVGLDTHVAVAHMVRYRQSY